MVFILAFLNGAFSFLGTRLTFGVSYSQRKDTHTKRCTLVLLTLLLLIPSTTFAQDPPYIECGAEDYLIERYYILNDPQFAELETELSEADTNLEQYTLIGSAYILLISRRDTWASLAEDGLPDCVQELHELTLKRDEQTRDSIALTLAGAASYNQQFSQLSGRYQAYRDLTDEQIQTILIELGWLDEDLEYTNEPPPLAE